MLTTSFAALLCAASANVAVAQPAAGQQVRVDADDIGGVAHWRERPRAGVWVIAETKDLPTKYVKIVVTDDAGRDTAAGFAERQLRRLGARLRLGRLPKVKAAPGSSLTSRPLRRPPCGGCGILSCAILVFDGRKLAATFPRYWTKRQQHVAADGRSGVWLRNMKTDGCVGCHQLGDKATRTIPTVFGHFNTGAEAWERRPVRPGQRRDDGRNRPLRHAAALALYGRLD
jgi:hypothetical protein